jgi:hypothetical protein
MLTILHTLKLLIPALIPSWNFFDIITPSPRVQYALLGTDNETAQAWHDYRPRPAHVSFLKMLGHMFWNAKWNESMFVVSCAERIMEQPTQHSEDEILRRIIADLADNSSTSRLLPATHVQFRIVVVERQDTELQQEVIFYSRILPLPDQDTA